MSEKRINRRDFLKLGGLAALSAPVVNVIGRIGDDEIIESKEEFGEFAIRRHSPDKPPYDIDPNVYKRMSMANTSFTRNPQLIPLRNANADANMKMESIGDDWLAYAYNAGSATFMLDSSMYDWEGLAPYSISAMPKGRWNPEEHGYSIDDVTKIIKRSSLLFGASLVGIAPLNELWFYSDTLDLTTIIAGGGPFAAPAGGGSKLEMDPELIQELMPKIIASMEPEDFKAMMIKVAENLDPDLLPMPLLVLKAMPPKTLQEKAPEMMGNMDPRIRDAMVANLDPSMMPDMVSVMSEMDVASLKKMMDTMVSQMKYDIIFSDEVDTPIVQDDKRIIPRSMNRVIVMAFEMDADGIDNGGVYHQVSVLGEGAPSNGYSRMAFTSACLAQMIRRLGWNAIPMGNDHALSIPMAVDAGLGELGRNGFLVTPKYGPRVRLAKVLTDMPLIPDVPISFGVTEFCEICGKCAKFCPSSAISKVERTYNAPESGISGLYHWPVEGDKCFEYWTEVGGSCYQCIRVCPFNKPEGWLHDATKILIGAKSGSIDQILLKLDDAAGYGKNKGDDPRDFWDKDTYIHIKN